MAFSCLVESDNPCKLVSSTCCGNPLGNFFCTDATTSVVAARICFDYNAVNGAVFEVHFEKARGISGRDTEPFEARLSTDAGGGMSWAIKTVENTTYSRVVELHELGLKPGDIAQELDIHKSSVSRSLKRAEAEGRIGKRNHDK